MRNRVAWWPFTASEPTTGPMETKHRTLIQASVLFILLVCAVASNGSQEKPAQVAEQVAATE